MTIFIIPGFKQSVHHEMWDSIKSYAKKHFDDVVMFQPKWKYHTLSEWVDELNEVRKKYHGPHFLLGFSFGAMIAYVSASVMPTHAQILCSLSPYFAEDLHKIRPWWRKIIGEKRIHDLANISFNKLAQNNTAETWMLVGEKEVPECISRFALAAHTMPHWHKQLIPNVGHDIGASGYSTAVNKVIALASK